MRHAGGAAWSDGHTLGTVIAEIEQQIGVARQRILTDAGYKAHNAPREHRFEVYTAGQKRGMTNEIRRLLAWLRLFLCAMLSAIAIVHEPSDQQIQLESCSSRATNYGATPAKLVAT